MQFAVWPSYDRPWQEALGLARWAEAQGLSGFWYADHFLEFGADDARGDGEVHECWTTLTAIGALVPRVRLVSMVSPITFHHPVVLTKRAVTTDRITGGRVVLGLGAGWQVNEHLAYGFELPPPGPRVSRFAEAIEVIHRLVHDERVTFEGEYYRIDDVALSPKPDGGVKLLVGTGGPRMMRLTARFADEWNTWGDAGQLRTRTDEFLRACDSVGRDPATVRRSAQATLHIVRDESQREEVARFAAPGRSLVGTPAEIVDLLGEIASMGIDEFGIPDFSLGSSAAERQDSLDLIAAEILPHLRG